MMCFGLKAIVLGKALDIQRPGLEARLGPKGQSQTQNKHFDLQWVHGALAMPQVSGEGPMTHMEIKMLIETQLGPKFPYLMVSVSVDHLNGSGSSSPIQ
jgi:hypothetical protein